MPGGGRPEVVPGDIGVEVGDAVDRHVTVGVRDQHRFGQPLDVSADVQTAGGQEVGERAEPRSRVVVAGGEHDLRSRVAYPAQHAGGQLHRVDGGDCAVVQVAGHQDDVDPFPFHQLGECGQHLLLVGEQAAPVE